MTRDLLPAQEQPTENWGSWIISGGRRSGRTTALVVAAGQRAAAGERVAYVDPWVDPRRLPSKVGWLLQEFGVADFAVHAASGEIRFPSGGAIVPMNPGLGQGARPVMQPYDSVFIDDATEVSDPMRERALLSLIRELRHRGAKRWAEAMLAPPASGPLLRSEHLTIPTPEEDRA